MRIFYSELCLIGGEVEENVDLLIEQGAENIELMLDGAGWNDFHLRIETISRRLKTKGVGYSVHAPVWDANLTSENTHLRAAAEETYRLSIEFAGSIGARHVVLHPGYCGDIHFSKETARNRAREALLRLLETGREAEVPLLVENVGTVGKSLFTQAEYASFLDGFPEGIGYIVDIGHAFINRWDLGELLQAIRDRLSALHIHDNDGKTDAHAPIGEGIIDWDSVFTAVRNLDTDLSLILEYNIGIDTRRLPHGKTILETAFPVRDAHAPRREHT